MRVKAHPVAATCKGALIGAPVGAVIAFVGLKAIALPEVAACLAAIVAATAIAFFSSRASLYETGVGFPIVPATAFGAVAGCVIALAAYWLEFVTQRWLFFLIPGTVSGGITGLAGALLQRLTAVQIKQESCPSCHKEFQPLTQRCPHCGVDLVAE